MKSFKLVLSSFYWLTNHLCFQNELGILCVAVGGYCHAFFFFHSEILKNRYSHPPPLVLLGSLSVESNGD